jgi:hypothetical protein
MAGTLSSAVVAISETPKAPENVVITQDGEVKYSTEDSDGYTGESVKKNPTETDLRNIHALNAQGLQRLRNRGDVGGNRVLGIVPGDVPGVAPLREIARAFSIKAQWFTLNPGLTAEERRKWGFFNGANFGGVA